MTVEWAWNLWRMYWERHTGQANTMLYAQLPAGGQMAWHDTVVGICRRLDEEVTQPRENLTAKLVAMNNKFTALLKEKADLQLAKDQAEAEKAKALLAFADMKEKYEQTRLLRISRKTSLAGTYEQVNFVRHPLTPDDVFFRREPFSDSTLIFRDEEEKRIVEGILEYQVPELFPTNGRRQKGQ